MTDTQNQSSPTFRGIPNSLNSDACPPMLVEGGLSSKQCATCHRFKSLSEFGKNSQTKDGYRGECKDCRCARSVRYRDTNAVNIERSSRKWRDSHPHYCHEHYIANKAIYLEQSREWHKRNAQLDRTLKRNWYHAHKEEHLAKCAEWAKNNRAAIRVHKQQWKQRHKENTRACVLRRRAKLYNASGWEYTTEIHGLESEYGMLKIYDLSWYSRIIQRISNETAVTQ